MQIAFGKIRKPVYNEMKRHENKIYYCSRKVKHSEEESIIFTMGRTVVLYMSAIIIQAEIYYLHRNK